MTEYKVTIGVKELRITAETEGEATRQAMTLLNDSVAWVQVARVEPRQTGFRYEPVPPSEDAP